MVNHSLKEEFQFKKNLIIFILQSAINLQNCQLTSYQKALLVYLILKVKVIVGGYIILTFKFEQTSFGVDL